MTDGTYENEIECRGEDRNKRLVMCLRKRLELGPEIVSDAQLLEDMRGSGPEAWCNLQLAQEDLETSLKPIADKIASGIDLLIKRLGRIGKRT